MAEGLGRVVPKWGKQPGGEGWRLKHLRKPLAAPEFHGQAVAEANEVLLTLVKEARFPAELANVKIIGPLSRNIALVNLRPAPPADLSARITEALLRLSVISEVLIVDRPLTLVAKAGPAVAGDPHARYWLQHGRLQPDFAQPIQVEWLPSSNAPLHPVHVVDFRARSRS